MALFSQGIYDQWLVGVAGFYHKNIPFGTDAIDVLTHGNG